MPAARYLFKAASLRGAPVLQGGIQLLGELQPPLGGFYPPVGLGDVPLPKGRTQTPLQPPLPLPGTDY